MRIQASVIITLFNIVSVEGHTRNIRNAHRNLKKNTQAEKCTIVAAAALAIEPGMIEDVTFDCVLDPVDTNGVSGLTRRIAATPGQKAELEAMLENGDLVSGESTLVHGQGVPFDDGNLFIPPGQDIANSVHKQGGGGARRRLAVTLGDKPILVVKVTDSGGLARSETPAQISENIFGPTDPVNLKSQLFDCSWGQLNVIPGGIDPAHAIAGAPGVIEVDIPISLTDNSRGNIRNAVTNAVNAKLGGSLPGPYQQVMYVLQGCYVDCGWAAYAYINSWNSVYQGNYYYMTGVLVHELGHNFNLAHSGGLDGQTYTDHMGMMGNPLYSDDTGKMCYNAAKNWQLNWYNDAKETFNPSNGPASFDMIGIGEYKDGNGNFNGKPVVIKIAGTTKDYFVGFNRATGPNSQNDEADNEVSVVERNFGTGYSQSFLKAHLVQGETYLLTDTSPSLYITAKSIDIGTSPGVANVCISSVAIGGQADCGSVEPQPTPAPTPAPTNQPVEPTPFPTPAPTSAPTPAPTNQPVDPTPAPTPAPTSNPVTPAPTPAPVTPAPTPAPVTPAPTPAPVCTGLDSGTSCDHRGNCVEADEACCTECCSQSFSGNGNSKTCL